MAWSADGSARDSSGCILCCKSYTLRDSTLAGPIEIAFGRGLARSVGQAIARKPGIPLQAGRHRLRVDIGHLPDCLRWSRRFAEHQHVDSTFPLSVLWPDGMWLEQTSWCA